MISRPPNRVPHAHSVPLGKHPTCVRGQPEVPAQLSASWYRWVETERTWNPDIIRYPSVPGGIV